MRDAPRGAVRRRPLRSEGLMRLAIIRQRYSPGGAIESRLEAALAALLERNVAI